MTTQKLTPAQGTKLDRLLTSLGEVQTRMEVRLSEMETRIAEMSQSPGVHFSPGPTDDLKAAIKEALTEARSVQASMGQDKPHHHGMTDPTCPDCIHVVKASLDNIEALAIRDTTAYFESIPGVKAARDTWEQLKAEKASGETDSSPPVHWTKLPLSQLTIVK